MKSMTRLAFAVTAAATLCLGSPVHASELIANGGFELGFASWTHADSLGSDGSFFVQSGALSPLNLDPVPAPPGGTRAAMSDAGGPGSHVLYQDFLVPLLFTNAVLDFDLFVGNRAPLFATPAVGLDWTTPALNQQARVDILRGGTDPFSVAGADVLLNVFQTMPGNIFPPIYQPHTTDLSTLFGAHGGETLRLRFAEADNVAPLQLGVDKVSLRTNVAAVPEPASLLLVGAGLAALLARRRNS